MVKKIKAIRLAQGDQMNNHWCINQLAQIDNRLFDLYCQMQKVKENNSL
jgi:hypothetical protein